MAQTNTKSHNLKVLTSHDTCEQQKDGHLEGGCVCQCLLHGDDISLAEILLEGMVWGLTAQRRQTNGETTKGSLSSIYSFIDSFIHSFIEVIHSFIQSGRQSVSQSLTA